MDKRKSFILYDVEILPTPFRNFSGRQTKYNAEGDRNFCIVIPPDLAEELAKDDWNVKPLNARNEDEEDRYYIKIKVRFNNNRSRPKIVQITSGGKTLLDEESVENLDWADIVTADVSINPYESTVRGEHHMSGYLKSLFVTIDEDELDKKYSDVESIGTDVVDEDIPF